MVNDWGHAIFTPAGLLGGVLPSLSRQCQVKQGARSFNDLWNDNTAGQARTHDVPPHQLWVHYFNNFFLCAKYRSIDLQRKMQPETLRIPDVSPWNIQFTKKYIFLSVKKNSLSSGKYHEKFNCEISSQNMKIFKYILIRATSLHPDL